MYRIKRIYQYFRYNIPTGIKNLIIWFPTVWCDRQWDHQYIYKILRQKLHFTEQYIRYHGNHINNIKDANKIKICVNLLDRLIANEYHESAFKEHRDKWGEPKMNFSPLEGDVFTDEERENYLELDIKYPNVKTILDKEKMEKEFRFLCHREEQLRNADLDLLFKLIRKHIQTWWD